MVNVSKIQEIAEKHLEGTDMFVVDVSISSNSDIEVLVDSDTSVTVDVCAGLSRTIEAELDREDDDFALTVSSAGIGQPLKVFRQYLKLVGSPVEVVLKNGMKVTADLKDATTESITLVYEEKVVVEGKKRKEIVERVVEYQLAEVKSTKERLDFK